MQEHLLCTVVYITHPTELKRFMKDSQKCHKWWIQCAFSIDFLGWCLYLPLGGRCCKMEASQYPHKSYIFQFPLRICIHSQFSQCSQWDWVHISTCISVHLSDRRNLYLQNFNPLFVVINVVLMIYNISFIDLSHIVDFQRWLTQYRF